MLAIKPSICIMAAAGGGRGVLEEEAEPPVQYHMSDEEEAIYARAQRPRSPTSPGYSYRPTVPDAAGAADDNMVDEEDDGMVDDAAGGYSSSSEDDEEWPDCVYEDDPPDPIGAQRQAEELAGYALDHYNSDPSNVVKYDLVEATDFKHILAGYAHINFVARPRTGRGKERLFFAELYQQLGRHTMVPTCLRSLDSDDDRGVGGLNGEPSWQDHARADGARYCFACHGGLKHPKDGSCYRAGHWDEPWT
ncbi:hypothetical protein HU200_067218 [Digitaria exilis]|uniref:DUF3615 domain-containing protein n=1 Tax=Digitaria exilis TaxID=1010633 RepID=A0A835DW10_9POAL|nr:hypothetical protein HU200_067218 [Digitaria exilis]